MTRTEDGQRLGLRERKKAKTRALIQAHALRLFHEQGYKETSIEQIAAAAEVSPSTVFHYFRTKPDLVIYDSMDEPMAEAFRALPPDLGALQALRTALMSGFSASAGADLIMQRERAHLMRSVPELRSAMIDELARTLRGIMDLLAKRSGRLVGDDTIVALSGAVIGVGIAAWLASEGDDTTERFLERMDTGMAMLESGFRL